MKFMPTRNSIFVRTFLSMLVLSAVIVMVFSAIEIPRNRDLIIKGFESQAKSLSASIAEVSGNAFVTGDYSFIVDHNMQVIKGSPDIVYIIVVKRDGLSMVHTAETWTQQDKPDQAWRPQLLAVLTKWLGGWEHSTRTEREGHRSTQSQAPAPGREGLDGDGFDRHALDSLRMIQKEGARNLVEMAISMFLETMPESLAELRQAASSGDAQTMFMVGHSLKSSSAQVGAVRLSSFFKEMERAGRENSVKGAEDILSKIEAEFEETQDVLKVELKGIHAPQANA